MIEPLPDLGASTPLFDLSLPPEVRLHRFRLEETQFPLAEAQARLQDGAMHGPTLRALDASYAAELSRKIEQGSVSDADSLLANLRLWLEDRRRLPHGTATKGLARWANEAFRRGLVSAEDVVTLSCGLPPPKSEIGTQSAVLLEGIASPLYVCRAMQECQELADWVASLGLTGALDPSHLHITIAYSVSPVDPVDFLLDLLPIRIIVDAVRPTMIDRALALPLNVSELHDAHRRYLRAGATYDYIDGLYQPHVSIKYDANEQDLKRALNAPAFTGTIGLGREWASILMRGWRPTPPN